MHPPNISSPVLNNWNFQLLVHICVLKTLFECPFFEYAVFCDFLFSSYQYLQGRFLCRRSLKPTTKAYLNLFPLKRHVRPRIAVDTYTNSNVSVVEKLVRPITGSHVPFVLKILYKTCRALLKSHGKGICYSIAN